MLQKNGIDRPPLNLDLERDWVCSNKAGNSCSNIVYKLSLAASIYGLWRERNCRIFQQKVGPAATLLIQIEEQVRDCICSWRKVKRSDKNRLMAIAWRVSPRIFEV
ncbi:hypothetical protein Vadar_014507 [Vaccinium darrowii]|uniref:Uncharacterized protein n=1 Tax=Vaccinium darrowii TaxID=229202 RepID=A0ACB7YVU2_9ERIC|nr:hypothetical protein Vadar_014507 [Vaccinium darrowii]